ncbi:adenosine monophosphate deaminase [Cryptosporidium felis]|nr:adenosine monophosphate deaminase [Cryptosporidium felis]
MIIEQKTGEEIRKLTGRNIILPPNESTISYLGLYEEHGKIGDDDYLRYGVRYIGGKVIGGNGERIVIGEIFGEVLSLDSLIIKSREYEYTEPNSSLNWVWRYNGIAIDTRNNTGILGFIQKTWKESDESNCKLDVIDGRLYVTTIENINIYPGDELVLSVNNNMDLLIPTIGDELMKLRSRNRKFEKKLERFNFKDSPKSYDITTASVSSSTTITRSIASDEKYECNSNTFIPYSLNCTNEYYCNLCSRSHQKSGMGSNGLFGEFKFSTRIFKNALVFILGEKENALGLSENQIHFFDRWKSTSCERELYSLASVHKISFKSKKGISIESIKEENRENGQALGIPIEALLVKNYISRSNYKMLISEFQVLKDERGPKCGSLTKKFYISHSVLLYYFFDKWMNERFVNEYKYLRIPIPMLIEQHRQLLVPYPEGVNWNLETLSWRYNIQKKNADRAGRQANGIRISSETGINDQTTQEQEFIGVSISNESDPLEIFKSYITVCSIKFKSIANSKLKESSTFCNVNSGKTESGFESRSNNSSCRRRRIKDTEGLKLKDYENGLYEFETPDFTKRIDGLYGTLANSRDNCSLPDLIDRCIEINGLELINCANKQLLTVASDDIRIISQQVEMLLVPPYSSFIRFCSKRLGFSITYNKRRAWFSVRTRGVLEAFNLAIKWIKKQKSMNEQNRTNYSDISLGRDTYLAGANPSENSKSNNNLRKISHKLASLTTQVNAALTKNERINFEESDADSVASFNKQANRLKPLPKRIIWVPSRRVFIVSYKRLGTPNQMNTKSFNPTIYGGVKKALKHACIFQSQTEQCKYNGFAENGGMEETNHSYAVIQNKVDEEENDKVEASLKPLNYWVKSFDSKVPPEKVTSAYREAVSTYLTHSNSFSQNSPSSMGVEISLGDPESRSFSNKTGYPESTEKGHLVSSLGIEINNSTQDPISSVLTKIDENYVNNFNTDYILNLESNPSNPINHGNPLFSKELEGEDRDAGGAFEFKPFIMYHDQVFIDKESVSNLMNVDETIYFRNSSNQQNDSADGQTIILDEEACTENLVREAPYAQSMPGFTDSYDDCKISEPLISISNPHSSIIQFEDLPTFNDQYINMTSPYEYIDSFTLIEP